MVTNLTYTLPKLLHFGKLYRKTFDPPPKKFANPQIGDPPQKGGGAESMSIMHEKCLMHHH